MPKEPNNNKLFFDLDPSLSFSEKANYLFEQQTGNWKLASDGYRSLSQVQKKIFDFDNFKIEAHFNPGRVISSSAKVDEKSVNSRPCFLCAHNLPEEQKAVELVNDYILLVNPYPIFDKHFTIPSLNHSPQQILTEVENMLVISSMLGKEYSVFYNGPKCGASAPDHLHFQAGNFGFMNIDLEFDSLKKHYRKNLYVNNNINVTAFSGCLRNFISIESNDIMTIKNEFTRIYKLLSKSNPNEEPMMNVLCSYNEQWRVIIFPRSKHRPTYFFEEGEQNYLISPAAVDFGGVLIFPRKIDFDRITKELIIDIFEQVSINDNDFQNFTNELMSSRN